MEDMFKFKDYDYLINKDKLYRFNTNIIMTVMYFLGVLFCLFKMFDSSRNTFYFFRFSLSKVFFIGFICSALLFIGHILDIIIVDTKRLVEKISFNNRSLVIKVKGEEVVEIKVFLLVTNRKDLKYQNKFWSKSTKRYEYEYIGIKVNNEIYIIPCRVKYKDKLINLINNSNDSLK